MRLTRIVYVGTFPPPEGGVRVLVRQLAQGLDADGRFELRIVDLTTPPGWPKAAHQARCMASIARRLRGADLVMLSAPSNYIEQVGPVVAALARAAGLPLVVRLFAGSQRQRHQARPAPLRGLLERTVFAGAALFVETRADVAWFDAHVRAPVHWLPNHRPAPELDRPAGAERAHRFMFLGAVHPEKGVPELIEAATRLADEGLDLVVDLYGPDRMEVGTHLDGVDVVQMHGALAWEQVYATLGQHDVLVLPSHREGYPGVVIEAFMVGLPVVSTRLEGLLEMTEPGVDSLLVEPRDVDGLTAALRRLITEPELFAALRDGAWAARDRFSAATWNRRVADRLVEVAAQRDTSQDRMEAPTEE